MTFVIFFYFYVIRTYNLLFPLKTSSYYDLILIINYDIVILKVLPYLDEDGSYS